MTSKVTIVIIRIRGLISLQKAPHEPPSRPSQVVKTSEARAAATAEAKAFLVVDRPVLRVP